MKSLKKDSFLASTLSRIDGENSGTIHLIADQSEPTFSLSHRLSDRVSNFNASKQTLIVAFCTPVS